MNGSNTVKLKHICFISFLTNGIRWGRKVKQIHFSKQKQLAFPPYSNQRMILKSSLTVIIFPTQQTLHFNPSLAVTIINSSSTTMGDSIHQNIANHKDLADSGSGEDDNHYHLRGRRNETRDESHFVNFLNTIISGTARLNVLLPTATILAFTNFTPVITKDGQCDTLDRWILGFFLTLASLYCIFFSLTDSYRTSKGRLYYGIATFSGILPLNGAGRKPHSPSEYRLALADLYHATMSLVAFLTFAASQKDVVECYYPELPRKVSYIVPALVESVVGALIVLFPSRRKGIGYPFLLQKDDLNSSTN